MSYEGGRICATFTGYKGCETADMDRQEHLSPRRPANPKRKARATAMICLAGLLAIAPVAARADSYVIRIRQEGTTNAIALSCADDADHLCRGEIALSVDGHEQPVAVIAFVEPGNAYLKFRLGDTYLFVASQRYRHVAIGKSVVHDIAALASPPSLSDEDDPDRLYHRPVVRRPQVLAPLEIEIGPVRREAPGQVR